ncbi:hypothetical protein SEA_NICEHOUSE_219 [Rhodococcus phage NiceHouse]|nr:hypothetical protein SEA_NICEHOUSE_219 [Rhodococcus phage NiceHouse]
MSYLTVAAALESGPKCPTPGLIIDIIEFDSQHFAYRLYRDNVEDYSDHDKALMFEWIKERAAVAVKFSNVAVGLEMAEYPHKPEESEDE